MTLMVAATALAYPLLLCSGCNYPPRKAEKRAPAAGENWDAAKRFQKPTLHESKFNFAKWNERES